jgi:hypothetical protein
MDLLDRSCRIDGFCPDCSQYSVFYRGSPQLKGGDHAGEHPRFFETNFCCSRDGNHRIKIYVLAGNNEIEKVGQYPSLADIANDAAKLYRRVLSTEDRAELSRAVGLASHGIGIGSFVYLRRVFERLIATRKESSGIEPGDFAGKRMGEQIEILKDHLPSFLVEHKSIYGILSKGVHELTEQDCLAFYDVLHESILVILEDDRRKREDEERRKRLSETIKNFESKQ